MARRTKKNPVQAHLLVPEEPKTEWQKLLAHLEENIKMYVAGGLFVILCLAIGGLIRVNHVLSEKQLASKYAEAALVEDAAQRLEKYKEISSNAGVWTAEVLYMLGETALEAGKKDEAKGAFDKILADFGKSDYAAPAADGLAYILRNDGKLEESLAAYQKLVADRPGDFVSRRAHFTIGEILEKLNRPAEAIAAYQKQSEVFPESAAARRAEAALEKLRASNPELFPAEKADAGAPAEGDAAQTGTLSVEAAPVPAGEAKSE